MYSGPCTTNKIIRFSSLHISLVFALVLTAARCLCAQQPEVNALASRLAQDLIKTHERTVIVFDFVGPEKKSTALGQTISDHFRDALKKSSGDFTVIGRTQITQALETNRPFALDSQRHRVGTLAWEKTERRIDSRWDPGTRRNKSRNFGRELSYDERRGDERI